MFHKDSKIEFQGWVLDGTYLGNGASARVYRVRKGLEVAALKVFDPQIFAGDEEAQERLARQKNLVDVDLPELARILALGDATLNGVTAPAILMELCEGDSLEKPEFRNELSEGDIRKIIAGTARAAKSLLDLGYAHRDIKPANIMFAPEAGKVKLLDTGIIRPLAEHNDVSGYAFVGSKRYSPPEFLYREEDGTDPNTWAAITFYQLGATLYELILKRRPYEEIKVDAQIIARIPSQLPNLAGLCDIPPDLQYIILCSLKRDWRERLKCVRWEDFIEIESVKCELNLVPSSAAAGLVAPPSEFGVVQEDTIRRILLSAIKLVRQHVVAKGLVFRSTTDEIHTNFDVGKTTKSLFSAISIRLIPAQNNSLLLEIRDCSGKDLGEKYFLISPMLVETLVDVVVRQLDAVL